MDEIGTFKLFAPLWSDLQSQDTFPAKRPLLAHYTSISTLEKIMSSDEVWFSHPFYMNDMEELRFGIFEGAQAFRQHEPLQEACGNPSRFQLLLAAFERYLTEFWNTHAFDTYVFCFSEHSNEQTDGLLSMWRGYGENGAGAAIVFDTTAINHNEDTPIIIAAVKYASQEERRGWIRQRLDLLATIVRQNDIPDDRLHLPSLAFFERLKMFSLFSKHNGFSEEKEWRVVYMRDRDRQNRFDSMLGYAVGRGGLEPKLKFKIAPLAGLTEDDLSLEKIVHHIILGPSISSPLALTAVKRMLQKLGKERLSERLVASTTPYRPS